VGKGARECCCWVKRIDGVRPTRGFLEEGAMRGTKACAAQARNATKAKAEMKSLCMAIEEGCGGVCGICGVGKVSGIDEVAHA